MSQPLIADGAKRQFQDQQNDLTHWRYAQRPCWYWLTSLVAAALTGAVCLKIFLAFGRFHRERWFSDGSFVALAGTFLGMWVWVFTMALAKSVMSTACKLFTGRGLAAEYSYAQDESGEIVLGLSFLGVFAAEGLWIYLGVA